MAKRAVFFLSDRTGITAEMLGHSLLTQFEGLEFETHTLRFIDSVDKAELSVAKINQAAQQNGCRPLVFSTLINIQIKTIFGASEGLFLDLFDAFIGPLENELQTPSATIEGRSHAMGADNHYKARIDAVNFTLNSDDGVNVHNYPNADIILIGVSRSGKTPTCLYLAMQYGLTTANYPLTEEDLTVTRLPDILEPYRDKLFGLTINPQRLHQIRNERMSASRYASLEQCTFEVSCVENIYQREHIPFLNTSSMSIEEIATTILHRAGLERRLHP